SATHGGLQRVVIAVGLVYGHPDTAVTEERDVRIVIRGVCLERRQGAEGSQVCLRIVILMTVLAANILNVQYGLADRVLNAQAELGAYGRLIVASIQAGDVVDRNRPRVHHTGR